MALNAEELKELARLEAEAGIESSQGLPEGIYHVEIIKTDVGQAKSSGAPRFRVQHKVICGPSKGRQHSEFYSWFGKTAETNGKVQNVFTNTFLRNLEPTPPGLKEAVYGLLQKGKTNESATALMESIDPVLVGAQTYIRVVNRTDGDGTVARYIKGKDVSCDCITSAVAV